MCLRAPLEAFSGSQSYRCTGHLALFALGRLLSRPLRRRKLAKQLRWSEPGGVVIVGLFGSFQLTCGGCTSRFKARADPVTLSRPRPSCVWQILARARSSVDFRKRKHSISSHARVAEH